MPNRMTRDMMMPKMSTFCWSCFGVFRATNTIVNTKMLSMDSEYSMRYPVKNA